MVRYRRNRIQVGVFFFTLTLAERRSTVLVDHVGGLRAAFRVARHERPFTIDAIVILPDHLHAILTLPEGDADFAGRWRRIKGHFSTGLLAAGMAIERHANGELALWQRRYWEHTIRNEDDFARHVDYIHYNPVKHRLITRVRLAAFVVSSVCATGNIAGRLGGRCERRFVRLWRASGTIVARMSAATCGSWRKSEPGYRFAHPGYETTKRPNTPSRRFPPGTRASRGR